MKINSRAMIGLGVLALLLIALTLAIRPRNPESSAREEVSPAAETKDATTSPVARRAAAAKPISGAAGGHALPQKSAEPREEISAECKACRETTCTNYKHLGFDVLNGCMDQIDPSEGADKSDAKFNEDCVAVVRCATQTHCAQGAAGPLGCYCGSVGVDNCIEGGPGSDAPCANEWKRAARTNDHHELLLRWSDLKYPTGWANLLIECDRDDCKRQCSG